MESSSNATLTDHHIAWVDGTVAFFVDKYFDAAHAGRSTALPSAIDKATAELLAHRIAEMIGGTASEGPRNDMWPYVFKVERGDTSLVMFGVDLDNSGWAGEHDMPDGNYALYECRRCGARYSPFAEWGSPLAMLPAKCIPRSPQVES